MMVVVYLLRVVLIALHQQPLVKAVLAALPRHRDLLLTAVL